MIVQRAQRVEWSWPPVPVEETRPEIISAISEGCCPICGHRLIPCTVCSAESGWLLCETVDPDANDCTLPHHAEYRMLRAAAPC